jgi:hypothetical protein
MANANIRQHLRNRVIEDCRDDAAEDHLPQGWCGAWFTLDRHHQSLGEIPAT